MPKTRITITGDRQSETYSFWINLPHSCPDAIKEQIGNVLKQTGFMKSLQEHPQQTDILYCELHEEYLFKDTIDLIARQLAESGFEVMNPEPTA